MVLAGTSQIGTQCAIIWVLMMNTYEVPPPHLHCNPPAKTFTPPSAMRSAACRVAHIRITLDGGSRTEVPVRAGPVQRGAGALVVNEEPLWT